MFKVAYPWERTAMMNCLMVGLGGFIGSVSRCLISKIPMGFGTGFPVNTFVINIIGAFAIGCIASAAGKDMDARLLLFLKVGLCGGFTTFSTFSLETTRLMETGQWAAAVSYVAASTLLGILAVFSAQYILR